MLKTLFVVGFAAAALAGGAAQAAETMACTEANMKTVQAVVDKMKDAMQKDAATKEMTMAKDSMTKKDDKGCTDHMKNLQAMMPE